MAISFNPAADVARAYAPPKLDPARAESNRSGVDSRPAVERPVVSSRREAPAVQIRLSADALAVLERGRQDAPGKAPQSAPARPAGEPTKTAFSLADFLAGGRVDDTNKPANPTPVREPAAPVYAPPGSRIDILL